MNMSALSARRRSFGAGLGDFGLFVHVVEACGAGEAGAEDFFCGGLPADLADALLAGSGAERAARVRPGRYSTCQSPNPDFLASSSNLSDFSRAL